MNNDYGIKLDDLDSSLKKQIQNSSTQCEELAVQIKSEQEKTLQNIERLKTEVSSQYEEITKAKHISYEELKKLIDNKQLKICDKYLLTDYATKYKQPTSNIIKTADVEPLLLSASSENTLETIAYSPRFPQDIIYYDFNNNKCEDNKTPRNGFIVNRIDTILQNQAPADFRGILWVRYTPDETQYYLNDKLVDYEVWESGNAKEDVLYKSGNKILKSKNTNVPKNAEDTDVFVVVFDDITNESCALFMNDKTKKNKNISIKIGKMFERKTFGEQCFCNTLGNTSNLFNIVFSDSCNTNSFGNYCYANSFGKSCSNNSFGNSCYDNSFGNDCYDNSFGNDCNANNFGNDCNANNFGNSYIGNSFDNSCQYNSFDNSCHYNSFGNNCSSNSFGNDCDNNSFGNDCDNNSFGNDCDNNSFGNDCDNNSFDNYCDNNSFDNNCDSNSFDNNCDSNSFGNNCSSNSFGNNCDSNSFGNDCRYNSFLQHCWSNKINHNLTWAFVVTLYDKDITNLSEVYGVSQTITFSQYKTGEYFYSQAVKDSEKIKYTTIP